MHKAALIYSAYPDRAVGALKKGELTDVDCLEDDVLQRMTENAIQAVVEGEPGYPFPLQTLSSPPYVLYYQGDLNLLVQPLLGVVGPRKPSLYAKQVVVDLIQKLPAYTVSVISGGAEGVDRLAHDTCITWGVPTVVVLGWGLRRGYTQQARTFLQAVVDTGGLVLSQRRLDQTPTQRTFPQRNKIIAGLSTCLFVPSASANSGSLISIDFALQMGKHVYTVPNSLYDIGSEATNRYVAEKKVHALDRLERMLSNHFVCSMQGEPTSVSPVLEEDHRVLLEHLEQPMRMEQLLEKLVWPIGKLIAGISVLEMHTLIMEIEPGVYQKR